TNTWSSAGSMTYSRYIHTASLLGDGKVLVAGGYGGTPRGDSPPYDPRTQRWARTRARGTARHAHPRPPPLTAAVPPPGAVGAPATPPTAAERFHPSANAGTGAEAWGRSRYEHTAILIPQSGKVLVAGGYNASATLGTAELYDPASNTWSYAASMNAVRS